MERFYVEFDEPMSATLKRQLIPFALRFYKSLTPTNLDYIQTYITNMKPYYNSNNHTLSLFIDIIIIEFLQYDEKNAYIEHYEEKRMDLDNLLMGTRRRDCL